MARWGSRGRNGPPRAVLAVGLALCALAAVTAATAQAGGAQSEAAAARADVSRHWSGYAVTGARVSYSRVSGTWTEPAVSCSPGAARSLSTVWVGLGGYNAGSQILAQVGTDANCERSGEASYFAWFELVPDIAHDVAVRVAAGDSITGSVQMLNPRLVELRLENTTRHWTVTRDISWNIPDTSSAEWVVEAPYACQRFACRQAPLANFGSVAMHDIAAIGNGHLGALADPAWTTIRLRLAPCAEQEASDRSRADAATRSAVAGAEPGEPSADGSAFGIAWVPDVGRVGSCPGASAGGLPDVTIG